MHDIPGLCGHTVELLKQDGRVASDLWVVASELLLECSKFKGTDHATIERPSHSKPREITLQMTENTFKTNDGPEDSRQCFFSRRQKIVDGLGLG